MSNLSTAQQGQEVSFVIESQPPVSLPPTSSPSKPKVLVEAWSAMINGPADSSQEAMRKLFPYADNESSTLVWDPNDSSIGPLGSKRRRKFTSYCGADVEPFGTEYHGQMVPGELGSVFSLPLDVPPITTPAISASPTSLSLMPDVTEGMDTTTPPTRTYTPPLSPPDSPLTPPPSPPMTPSPTPPLIPTLNSPSSTLPSTPPAIASPLVRPPLPSPPPSSPPLYSPPLPSSPPSRTAGSIVSPPLSLPITSPVGTLSNSPLFTSKHRSSPPISNSYSPIQSSEDRLSPTVSPRIPLSPALPSDSLLAPVNSAGGVSPPISHPVQAASSYFPRT